MHRSADMPRRRFLQALTVAAAAPLAGIRRSRRAASAVVVGAGVFGGWTAWFLRQRGLAVTLVDAWGPGNARASSGGETRIIRATYGPQRVHTALTSRAITLWKEFEAKWGQPLYVRTGSLRMKSVPDDRFEQAAIPLLREAGLTLDALSLDEAARRFPHIDFAGVHHVYWEPEAGFLYARESCRTLVEQFVRAGGAYRQAMVQPGEMGGGRLAEVRLSDGTTLAADHFVFACGAWLRELIPEVVGDLIRPTRQEVFFFGSPPGDRRFDDPTMPVWVDAMPDRVWYGVPGNRERGFKVADDTRGARFEPTTGDRLPTAEGAASARTLLARRFPALKDAPLLDARVCQYENSPDGNFIVDQHPLAGNLWIAGGGSGHGFKHGPALGEMVAAQVLGERPREPAFRLARF
jgi:glycine/D-amino acid oxidase-like deaminating enzyme